MTFRVFTILCYSIFMRLPVALFTAWIVAAASLLASGPVTAGSAEQRLVELDTQFGKLQVKEDGLDAFQAEQKIWSLWMQSDNAEQDTLLASATVAMGGRDYRLAEVMLNKLIAENPKYAEAWNKRATLYYLMGRLDASLADIVATLDLEPRHFGALSGRGMILIKQGKTKEALAAYEEADAINPHMPNVRAAIRILKDAEPDL
jgi:tetratricopeptide (TPR) repeat protein